MYSFALYSGLSCLWVVEGKADFPFPLFEPGNLFFTRWTRSGAWCACSLTAAASRASPTAGAVLRALSLCPGFGPVGCSGLSSGRCLYGGFGFHHSSGNGRYERAPKRSGKFLGWRIAIEPPLRVEASCNRWVLVRQWMMSVSFNHLANIF